MKKNLKIQTVEDTIKHLQTLPPKMEVWIYCDEMNVYIPAIQPQGRVDHIVCKKKYKNAKRNEWQEAIRKDAGKAVVVLNGPQWPIPTMSDIPLTKETKND